MATHLLSRLNFHIPDKNGPVRAFIQAGFTRHAGRSLWFAADGGEDAQRLYTAIGAAGIASTFGAIYVQLLQACLREPIPDLHPIEAQPEVRHALALPFMVMLVQIGDAKHAAGLEQADHLQDGFERVRSMMEIHVGKDAVQELIG